MCCLSSHLQLSTSFCFATSPSGAVAKYCDECVCVCLCVCVSVCPRGFLRNHTRELYQFYACCLLPWLGPPLAGWQNHKGKGSFGSFLPHWQCIVQHSIWDTYKNGWTDRDAVWDDEWAEEQYVMWGWRSPKGKVNFGGKPVPNKPNTLWIEN